MVIVEDFESKRLTCGFTCLLIAMCVKSFTRIEFGTFWCLKMFNLKDKKTTKNDDNNYNYHNHNHNQSQQSQQDNIIFHVKPAF